jgi:hypothetical protein
LSSDGRSRWNGSAWVPAAAAPTPLYFQPQARARVATGWTKPLQYSVAALYLVQAIWDVTLPFLTAGPMSDYINQIVQRNAQLNPDVAPPPAAFLSAMTTILTWTLAIGAALGVAIAVVAIIGALKRWTWVFYAVLVLLGLQAVSLPFAVVSAVATSALNPVKLPAGLTWASVAFGVPAVALFVWMLVAVIRRGPWGMTRPIA